MTGDAAAHKSLVVYNTVLRVCQDRRDVERATAILEELQDNGLEPDIITWNTLLATFIDASSAKCADQVVEKMVGIGLKWDIVTYIQVIRLCALKEDVGQAMEYVQQLAAAGLDVDAAKWCKVMNTVLSACNRAQDVDTSLNLLERMKRCGVKPDAASYGLAIRTCTIKAPEKALALLEEARRNGVQLVEKDYFALLLACGRLGAWEDAACVLSDMKMSGVDVSERCYQQAQRSGCGHDLLPRAAYVS